MKLTKEQLNKIKKFIQNSENLKAVYGNSSDLWFSDYYNCWNFEYTAETENGIEFTDLMRFSVEELDQLLND